MLFKNFSLFISLLLLVPTQSHSTVVVIEPARPMYYYAPRYDIGNEPFWIMGGCLVALGALMGGVALYDCYKERQEKSLHEAEEILNSTKVNAQKMAEQAESDLKITLEKRMKLATDKIAQAEAKALQDVQNHVVDVAVAAARTIINEHLIRTGNGDIVQQAAAELSKRLH